ncbi:glutamate mutase L [Nocardioides sp. AE5]|uniref:glutamate mutase L n=1 Tax=Nocardioides sp. AE5 TaxID=2962573 RepID=UPI00288180A6|nr:glutamate mutase L [Nocardioides sp. AE5]MDT0202261.1 glutamate mutase L [Nocardioides sp. AE5]
MAGPLVCVDFGSTFTKALLIDPADGALLASATHRTTIDTDVLAGLDACRASLAEADPRARTAQVLACSSAGGGLRIAVVGNEELVTAEAGRRVALSSGGRVVATISAADTPDFLPGLHSARPDVVLLTGGTDGGNSRHLLGAARHLATTGSGGVPVVVAGNVAAREAASAILAEVPHVVADNIVPRIGVFAPESARSAVREMFLAHVIGGKQLSHRADFAAMVRGATPDLVLDGVSLLSSRISGDVAVVDIGGATTDVHSALEVVADGPLSREVVAPVPLTRTVEADLGMRWSAPSTVRAGIDERVLDADPELVAAAARRAADPAYLPGPGADPAELAADVEIATIAAGIALRRHCGRSRVVPGADGRVVERSGKDLRRVELLVGAGGVLRAATPDDVRRILTGLPAAAGWQVPEAPDLVVDSDQVIFAAGLLLGEHPAAAHALVDRLVSRVA